MKKFLSVTFLASMLALLLPACEGSKNPTEVSLSRQRGTLAPFSLQSLLPQDTVLSGFTVTYNGRTFAGGQTKFTYIVTGPADYYEFRLELPPCAGSLVSSSPAGGDTLDNGETEPFNPAIEWVRYPGEVESTLDTFSVTFSGLIREGIALTSIQTGESLPQKGSIAGPCARVFDISGTVFNDANTNGSKNAVESGISGVTVNLLDSNDVFLESLITDPSGNYKFESVPLGRYTVQVDTNTVAATSTKYLANTTPTSLSVTGGPDSPGNDFGFNPKAAALLADLRSGALPTNGLTVEFWKKQLAAAVREREKDTPIGVLRDASSERDRNRDNDKDKKPIVSKDSLRAYISRIRALLLPEPFQLGEGNGFEAALDILSKSPKTDLQKLRQQLLALEFNQVSRHGIVGTDAPLQLILVAWGEALVAGATTDAATPLSVGPSLETTMSALTDAAAVFAAISKSSGGGGTF